MSPLRWTCKSTTQLAIELRGRGHRVSQATAWRQLDELSYSMQSNRKTRERADHPDRNAHFEFIDLATLGPPNKGSPFVTNGQEAVRGLWSGVRGATPQAPSQQGCSGKACQRTRRRCWQREKRATDPDDRDSEIQAQAHPVYWRKYCR
jgi:hypothetical protein